MTGQKYTSTPFYIYYLQLPCYSEWGEGDRQDCLLTLNEIVLWLMTGRCGKSETATAGSEENVQQMFLNVRLSNSWLYLIKHCVVQRNRWHIQGPLL